jgi:hypothetical protein
MVWAGNTLHLVTLFVTGLTVPAVFSGSDIGIAAIVPPTPEVCDLVTLL